MRARREAASEPRTSTTQLPRAVKNRDPSITEEGNAAKRQRQAKMQAHVRRQALITKKRVDLDVEDPDDERRNLRLEGHALKSYQSAVEHVHQHPRATRALRAASRNDPWECGVLHFMCGGSLCGSQFQGKHWTHLAGFDTEEKFAPSFERNNKGGKLVKFDVLKRSAADFRKVLDYHKRRRNFVSKPGARRRLLLVIATLECGPASNANSAKTAKQRRLKKIKAKKFYRDAIAKYKEFLQEAEKDHNVFAVHEFLATKWVVAMMKKELPDATFITCHGQIHEDRKRVYAFQRAEGVPNFFLDELRKRVDAYGQKSAAEALEDIGVAVPPFTRVATGCWTKKEWRNEKKGRDPRRRRLQTICKNGYVMQYYKSARAKKTFRQRRLAPEALLHLRSAGCDYEYSFASTDVQDTKDQIVGMGVSLVIGAAMRAAFERYFEPDLALLEGVAFGKS